MQVSNRIRPLSLLIESVVWLVVDHLLFRMVDSFSPVLIATVALPGIVYGISVVSLIGVTIYGDDVSYDVDMLFNTSSVVGAASEKII